MFLCILNIFYFCVVDLKMLYLGFGALLDEIKNVDSQIQCYFNCMNFLLPFCFKT